MGNEQKRMEVFGFLKDEEINNRTMCTSFLLRRSSRVLRRNGVQILNQIQIIKKYAHSEMC